MLSSSDSALGCLGYHVCKFREGTLFLLKVSTDQLLFLDTCFLPVHLKSIDSAFWGYLYLNLSSIILRNEDKVPDGEKISSLHFLSMLEDLVSRLS